MTPISNIASVVLGLVLSLFLACSGTSGDSATTSGTPLTQGAGGGAATASDASGSGTGAVPSDTGSSTPTDVGAATGSDTAKPDGPECHPVKPASGPCPPGKHCVWQGESPACVPDGSHGAGENCDDGDGCKVGICVKNDDDKSRCAPHCFGDLDCASGQCNPLEEGKGKVCDMGGGSKPQCNPLAQNCSDSNEACYHTSNGFVCKTKGNVSAGGQCVDDNSCLPGHLCVGKTSSGGVCRKICSVTGSNGLTCPVGIKCSNYLGSSQVGYCPD